MQIVAEHVCTALILIRINLISTYLHGRGCEPLEQPKSLSTETAHQSAFLDNKLNSAKSKLRQTDGQKN